jgi:hypothetical protein
MSEAAIPVRHEIPGGREPFAVGLPGCPGVAGMICVRRYLARSRQGRQYGFTAERAELKRHADRH